MKQEIAALERCSFRAWPAREETRLGGWILRFADGYTRRANSVNPIEPIEIDPGEAIARCESLYAARGLRTVFKMTPASEPVDLDDRLAAAGYLRHAPTRVQTLDLGPPAGAVGEKGLELLPEFEERWLRSFSAWVDVPDSRRDGHRSILRAIVPARVFAILHGETGPVACGLAVRDEGLLGLYDLVTAPEARRQGLGARLVRALLAWGAREGCARAYLQVVEANAPARRLYRRIGFEDSYPYWYRVAPV